MRPFMQMLAVLAVVLCGAVLAKGEQPKSVRVLANGDEIHCYGSYCKRLPAAQAVLPRVVESVPTPAIFALGRSNSLALPRQRIPCESC